MWTRDAAHPLTPAAANLPKIRCGYPLIVGYALLAQEPLLAGLIVGFLILDERDQNTLVTLRVTPLPMGHYLLYRVLVPTLIAFVVVLVSFLLIGQALLPFWQLVAVSAGAAPFGAIVALFLAAFGEKKVQGFALNKIVGTVGRCCRRPGLSLRPSSTCSGYCPRSGR